MYERMAAMRAAKDYVQDRKTKWLNDTRDIVQQTDRLVHKGGAPKGWLDRNAKPRKTRARAIGGSSMRESIVPGGADDDFDAGFDTDERE